MDQKQFDNDTLFYLFIVALGGGLVQAIRKAMAKKSVKVWYFLGTLLASGLTSWFIGMIILAKYPDNIMLVLGITGITGTMSKSVIDAALCKYLNIKPDGEKIKKEG